VRYIIYLATGQQTRLQYIGQTRQTLPTRIKHHFWHAQHTDKRTPFQQQLLQEAFDWQQLDSCTSLRSALQRERELIRAYNTLVPFGLNVLLDERMPAPVKHSYIRKKVREYYILARYYRLKNGQNAC